jgi:hypothetical protein
MAFWPETLITSRVPRIYCGMVLEGGGALLVHFDAYLRHAESTLTLGTMKFICIVSLAISAPVINSCMF